MAADDQGTGSLLQAGGHTEQQQLVAGARAHSPPSAAATSHAPAPGEKADSAGPVSHGDHVGQCRRGGGGGSGNVSGSCSILSRGSSILSLSDLSSNQADQGGSSSEGGDEGEGDAGLREGSAGREGGVGLHEGAAAMPATHVDLPALPQDGMHTIKVGVGVGFSCCCR